ncbi:MAG TPA: hypothetical protein VIK59_00825 [Verrucomicrobiae bacterium]
MEETNPSEAHLRSWQPRRASAKVKRRLFAATGRARNKVAWLLGSLAPAAACALLTLSIFDSGNSGNLLSRQPVTEMILSNQNDAAYAAGNFSGAQNTLSSVTFEWTNRNGFTSSMAPFSHNR